MKQKLFKNDLITKLKKKKIKLCIAESITGGSFVREFIKKKGASSYIDFSIVCYSNESKQVFLDLKKDLNKNDVISSLIAKKMAINVTKYSNHKNIIGISCTGLASSNSKQISKMLPGTVFFAVFYKGKVKVKKKFFRNLTRNQVILETVKEMMILCNSVI